MSERSSHKSAPPTPTGSSTTGPMLRGDAPRDPAASDGQMTVISSRVPVPSPSFTRGEPLLDTGDLREGEQLGQFLLEKFVGGGGMGVVFRALDTTLNREVAVKVLSRDQSADDETLRRFRNEAQSAARLNHENIARVHYVGEDRGVHYIVFEFIEGVNIRDLVERNGPLPVDVAISYTHQIAQALEHASQRSVIHRDIKPSNVLITFDGKAKLVDMGLARLNQMAPDNDLTASGVTLGTFDYISPEQARDPRSADVRSDMYSLGCSFFYMLTGRPPFPDGTVLQKLLQHQADLPPDPRTTRPDLPADVARILARLLAKNPAYRYQQPSELIDELSALGEKLGVRLSSSHPHWAPSRSSGAMAAWQRHVPWAVPLAVLFLAVILLDFFGSDGSADAVGRTLAPSSAPRTTEPRSGPPSSAPSGPPPTSPGNGLFPNGVPAPGVEDSQPPAAGRSEAPSQETSPAPTSGEKSSAASLEPRPLWQRVFEPFAGGSIEQFRARMSEAARRASRPAPESVGVPPDAAAGAPAAPPRAAAANQPLAAQQNLLVVGEASGPRTYASLHAACNDAKSGDVIELRFNGRREEKPIAISNVKLTIRAGDRYQPVIVFRPEPDLVPVKYPTTMLSIAGSQLFVTGVHWELDLPRNVPSDWALFETRRSDLVQFDQCTFTIRNASLGQTAYHAGVAFIDVKAAPGTESMGLSPEPLEDQIVTVNLHDCLARGEAAFLRTNELQSVRLHWDNGLLATSERLLVATGRPFQPKPHGQVQINLRHVTAMVHGGLALLSNSEDAPYQLPTEIHCSDSVFVSTARPPLIEQRGSDDFEEYASLLRWSGGPDFFDGFDVFWQIVTTASQTTSKQMRFDEWREHWGADSRSLLARGGTPLWKGLARSDRPFHAQTAADYALDRDAANPALGAASDGLDAGCLLEQLPPLITDDASPAARHPQSATGGLSNGS